MTAAERQADTRPDIAPADWIGRLARRVSGVNANTTDVRVTPLAGGVSSDIYRVDADGLTFCVKRALPKLKVAADWQAPVGRNAFELAWLRAAADIVPQAVPRVLAEDREAGAFAMDWLPPERYPVWKVLLASGAIAPDDGSRVGDVLGRLHAATADRLEIAARFATDDLFDAIRLEPYLLATARRHDDLAGRLHGIAASVRQHRRVLVHGDFSPKNLLIGPDGPVVLDAECAWFGEPAFDLAFVLNHLLLKGAWHSQWRARYREVYDELVGAYRAHVAWERWSDLEQRTSALLPALMLARIDGKSPVEYLTDEPERERVRRFARERIVHAPATLGDVADAWESA